MKGFYYVWKGNTVLIFSNAGFNFNDHNEIIKYSN